MLYPFSGPLGTDESWGMFALTGNPAYYMLYRNINKTVDDADGEDNLRR